MNILVTGGAGFIGSHTVVELIAAGYTPVVVDSLVNSDQPIYNRLEKLTNSKIIHYNLDVRQTDELASIIEEHKCAGVIHFAALKAVGESVQKPLEYYKNNIDGLLSVIDAMQQSKIQSIIFSSSATVYGDPDSLPITEDAPLKTPTNPYGASKQMCEQILQDSSAAYGFKTALLRYFNPIGAHPSGLIGESPTGIPNNLVPYVAQVASGLRESLTIHGDDYNTPDGSGVRDYIHVVDLAKAHVMALKYLDNSKESATTLNIGTGNGTSVLEIIRSFEQASGKTIPYTIGPRRDGDIASCYASPAKAEKLIGWKAHLTIDQALRDAWNWQKNL